MGKKFPHSGMPFFQHEIKNVLTLILSSIKISFPYNFIVVTDYWCLNQSPEYSTKRITYAPLSCSLRPFLSPSTAQNTDEYKERNATTTNGAIECDPNNN